MVWVGFVVHFFMETTFRLYWSSRGFVVFNNLCFPFWVVRPFFYGNNAPLRYALYWSSRGFVVFNNLCFPFWVVRPLFLWKQRSAALHLVLEF
ncbi:hypothetical protein AF450_11925 [Listeria monocytogenes]|nr:hypothetical protein [Listeria monocytogenes]